MKNQFSTRIAAFAIALVVAAAPAAIAQSTMIKGKVVDGNKQPSVGFVRPGSVVVRARVGGEERGVGRERDGQGLAVAGEHRSVVDRDEGRGRIWTEVGPEGRYLREGRRLG